MEIEKIYINDDGELNVKPIENPDTVFRFVCRAAMEVDWNDKDQCFKCPKPRKWTYIDWFKQVVSAVHSEFGLILKVTEATQWLNIPDTLQSQIYSYKYEKNT